MPMTVNEYFAKIDFAQLRKQKILLQGLCDKAEGDRYDALQGLVALIDDMQDVAFEGGMAEAFFNSKNENCLQGLACPKCGHEDKFSISVDSMVDVTDDGTDEARYTPQWDEFSTIICSECSHEGEFWSFIG